MKEISELKSRGLSISQISSITGFDRKTLRKYLAYSLEKAGVAHLPRYGPRPHQGSKLDTFKPYLTQRMTISAHHAGIPLDIRDKGGKPRLLIRVGEDEASRVEVRSLLAYEQSYEHVCEHAYESEACHE